LSLGNDLRTTREHCGHAAAKARDKRAVACPLIEPRWRAGARPRY
jgi:hypothetical protein